MDKTIIKIELEITESDIQTFLDKIEYIRTREGVYPYIKSKEMLWIYLTICNEYYDYDKVLCIYNYFLREDQKEFLLDRIYKQYKLNFLNQTM